jgi:hypothetical protein
MRTGLLPAALAVATLALLALPTYALGQQDVPGVAVETSHRQLGPFEITGGTVRVDLRIERLVPEEGQELELDSTTLVVGFMDEDGEWLFRRPLPNRITPEGYDHCFFVSVEPLELPDRRVLRVTYELAPSAPMTGYAVRLFGWRDGAFGPLGPGITGYGTFAELPAGDAPETRALLDGALPFDAWTGYFAVRVPVRFHGDDGAAGPTGPWSLPGETPDRWVGSLPLPETGRHPVRSREVTLYPSPEGGEASGTVTVGPDTEVEFGPAWGEVHLVADRRGQLVTIEVDVERLHVVIDGREGWTTDYRALGLPAAG